MDFSLLVLLVVALLMGLGIGAASASNCFAATFGSGVLSYKKSLTIVFFFLILGAVLQGGKVTKTVGKGLIDASALPFHANIAIMLGAALLLLMFAFYGLPVSSTHAIIGSLLGVAVALGTTVNWHKFFIIFGFWILTPFIAIFFGVLSYYLASLVVEKASILRFERYIKYLVIGSMIFLSYSFGANHVGLVVGLVSKQLSLPPYLIIFLAALSIGFGAIFLSKRITMTMGKKITELDPRMAFSSQTGGAISIYIMTLLGIPTSSTQATVGGIAGSGLSKSVATVDKAQLWKIFRGWVLTPLIGAIFGMLSFYILGGIL